MNLILRPLQLSDEQAFYRAIEDWPETERGWITFDWQLGMLFSEHIERLRLDEQGIDLPENKVPHTMLYGFVGDNIVGRVSVRHELNDFLMNFGGNIGYAVSAKYRTKGYAKEMVRQSIAYLKKLGLVKILITCDDDNHASLKIIKSLNGQLENKVIHPHDNKLTCRFWVDLA